MFENYSKREKRLSILLGISILLSIMTITSSRFSGFTNRIIDGDGRASYAWLPALFIYHSTDFTNVYNYEKSVLPEDYMGHYFIDHNDVKINKYYCGTAILMLPFFLLAFIISWLTGMELNGYSVLFQYGILLASVFYSIAGLLLLYSSLRKLSIDKYSSFFTIIILLFGTNLFYYTFMHAAASHVYSFFAASLFIYLVISLINSFYTGKAVLLAFTLGVIVLIRPVNALIVLSIPFLAGNWKSFSFFIKQWFYPIKNLAYPLLILILTIGMQFTLFYFQTGKFYVWTYQGEGFDFSNPEISNVLFSYRKGLFVYTPVLVFSLAGLLILIRKNIFRFFSGFLYLFIISLTISSWWNWYYGDSFGMRAFIDHLPVMAILLAIFLYYTRFSILRMLLYLVFGILIFFNLFQTYQYEHNILDRESMDKEKYWYVFLKSGKEYEGLLSGLGDARFLQTDTVFLAAIFTTLIPSMIIGM